MTAIVTRGNAADLHLPDESVDLVVTSPPYFGLRSYQDGGEHYEGQVGDEATPTEYLDALIACTAEWVRVLKPGGSIFVNLGDKYSGAAGPKAGGRPAGLVDGHNVDRWVDVPRGRAVVGAPAKSLFGLPWRYAIRCIDDLGLILRAEIVWAKPNGLPESVTDRVRRSHEQVFHFVKQPRYFSAVDEVREVYGAEPKKKGHLHSPTRGYDADVVGIIPHNPLGKLPGSVWTIPTSPLRVPESLGIDHFAAYPPELVRRIVLGWSPRGVCTACGEGRRPVTERTAMVVKPSARRQAAIDSGNAQRTSTSGTMVSPPTAVITGYACACPPCPACDGTGKSWLPGVNGCQTCPPSTPGVVLDPFGGTGTTALVASCYGRVGISVDLSADYCRLAQWRTTEPGERARVLGVEKPEPVPEGQLGMFDVDPAPAKPSGGLAYAEKKGRNCPGCGYRTQYAGPTCDRCGAERGAA